MRHRHVVLLCCLLPSLLWADLRQWPRVVVSDVRQGIHTSIEFIQTPARASRHDLQVAGGVAAGVLAASLLDNSIRAGMRRWDAPGLESIDDAGYGLSRPYVTLGAGSGLYLIGLTTERSGLRRTGQEILEAFFLAHAGTQTLKYVLGRNRPFNERGPFRFSGPTGEDRFHAFPSGDVTSAFALTTVLAGELEQPALSVLLYSLAGATLFQRLHEDRHWFSDTAAAALWSTAVARGVLHYHRVNPSPAWRLQPAPAGVALIWSLGG